MNRIIDKIIDTFNSDDLCTIKINGYLYINNEYGNTIDIMSGDLRWGADVTVGWLSLDSIYSIVVYKRHTPVFNYHFLEGVTLNEIR